MLACSIVIYNRPKGLYCLTVSFLPSTLFDCSTADLYFVSLLGLLALHRSASKCFQPNCLLPGTFCRLTSTKAAASCQYFLSHTVLAWLSPLPLHIFSSTSVYLNHQSKLFTLPLVLNVPVLSILATLSYSKCMCPSVHS